MLNKLSTHISDVISTLLVRPGEVSSGVVQVSDPTAYYKALEKACWRLKDLQWIPQVVKVLALWRPNDMPEPLLQELVESRRMDLEALLSMDLLSAGEAFASLEKIVFELEDAEQLGLVAVALQLSTGLKDLKVSCFTCFNKKPTLVHLTQMSVHLSEVTNLTMSSFAFSEFPSALFPANNSLKHLDLNGNELLLPTRLPESLERLQSLGLDNNKLTQLPENVFQHLEHLKTLNLRVNKLTELPENVFDHLAKLQTLNLRVNKLAQLPGNVFDHLAKLQTLTLDGNKLAQLPETVFNHLAELQALWLENNRLAQLPKNVFQHLAKLQKLTLCSSDLQRLPEKQSKALEMSKYLYVMKNC